MLRFLSSLVLALPLILPESAQARCVPPLQYQGPGFNDFANKYNHWREAELDRRKHHERRRHERKGRGKCKGRPGGHRRPLPPPLPPCMINITNCSTPEKPTRFRVDVDKGFCPIENSKYQSDVFELVGQPHMLFIYVLNNELRLELVKFNNTHNITDDDRYYAEPEGFAQPAEPSQTPLAAFPDKVQKESNKLVCDNSRSLVWGVSEGKALPSYFGGRIDLFSVKGGLYTNTSLSTDLTSSAYMEIMLKKVPDKHKK